MTAHANAPVIIKRKKIIAGGHHGGAWKVAYADFVTAMMAFFLLMWLLGSTTDNQRKGLADYFSPTVPIARVSAGGSGSFGGDDVFSDEKLAKSGSGASQRHHSDNDKSRGLTGADPDAEDRAKDEAMTEQLTEIAENLTARSGESMVSEELARHIITRVTDEGLIVDLFDLPGAVLFEADSLAPTPLLRDLVRVVTEVFAITTNRVAVSGHVRSQPVVLRNTEVWDRSLARADIVREMARDDGIADRRFHRVAGLADRELADPNPMAVRNNRIEMTLLR